MDQAVTPEQLGIGPDDVEYLRMLRDSPAWGVYRGVLMKLKDGYFHSTLTKAEPNDVMKTVGMVLGINLAINQLPAILQTYDMRVKREEERKAADKKETKPRKGRL